MPVDPTPPRPTLHLLRAAEEISRAAADALALARRRAEQASPPSDDPIAAGLEQIAAWLARAPDGGLDTLVDALERERSRWHERSADDPTAAGVRDLVDVLLAVLRRPESARMRRDRSAKAAHRPPRPVSR